MLVYNDFVTAHIFETVFSRYWSDDGLLPLVWNFTATYIGQRRMVLAQDTRTSRHAYAMTY